MFYCQKFLIKLFSFILLLESINSQLTILNPPSLSSRFINNTINMQYGTVGVLNDFYIRGQIILETITPTRDACYPLTGINLRKNNNTIYDENFKILITFSGSCSFSQKARNAQNAGASMIIIINKNNDLIKREMGNDIYIPVAFINNKDGKILEEFILNNPNEQILVEVDFTPTEKDFVYFKFFFSSSEPKAYELIGNMTKYLYQFGGNVFFTPFYVVHKNPYYVYENPTSDTNCISRGVYCYYPKETTITQEGRKILMEDIRQKCMYRLNRGDNIKYYFKYLATFAKLCINTEKKSLTRECSQKTLIELGYSKDYLDKCVATSFDVLPGDLNYNYYLEKNNKLLEREYNRIIRYKLTSFPAVLIDGKQISGIIKEQNIVINLCDKVKEKPSFCSYFTGFTDEHRKQSKNRSFLIYFLIFLLIVVNIGLFFMCRTYVLEKLKDRVNFENIDVEGRIKNIINNYFALRNNNDYQSFENQNNNHSLSQNYIMTEGKVDTV